MLSTVTLAGRTRQIGTRTKAQKELPSPVIVLGPISDEAHILALRYENWRVCFNPEQS